MKTNYMAGGIGLLTLVLASAPAPAQEILSDPAAVRACLCQHQSLDTLSGQVTEQRRLYDERRQTLETLQSQVAAERAKLAAAPGGDTTAFEALLDRRDQAETQFADEATPAYAAAVGRYNSAVAAFNEQCAGKIYAPQVETRIKSSGLDCPKP